MQALVTAGVDSFEKLVSADPRRLEAITGRKFPYGDQLKASLNDVPPKVEMNLFENGRDDQCLLTLHRVSQPQSSGKNFHMAELVSSSSTLISFKSSCHRQYARIWLCMAVRPNIRKRKIEVTSRI